MRPKTPDTVIPRGLSPVAPGRRLRRHLARAALATMAVAVLGAPSSAAYAAGATVDVATTASFGTVLSDAQGFALYTFPSDHNGISACTGACVSVWPALTVPAGTTPTAGTGVPGTVASVLQANGTYQVTYNGAPLYTFVGDTTPGAVTGNNVGGFKVAAVTAAPSTPTTSAPAPTTGSTAPSTPTTAAPASTTPTTRAPAPVAPPARAAAPATAVVSGASPAPVPAAAATTNAPTSLATTGPGPALRWMVLAGVVLVVSSLTMLSMLGNRSRRPHVVLQRARRAGGWLLGR